MWARIHRDLARVAAAVTPWNTVWIIGQPIVNGAPWAQGRIALYASALLWGMWLMGSVARAEYRLRYVSIWNTVLNYIKRQNTVVFILFIILFFWSIFAWFSGGILVLQTVVATLLLALLLVVLPVALREDKQLAVFWYGSVIFAIAVSAIFLLVGHTVPSALFGIAAHSVGDPVSVRVANNSVLRLYGIASHPNIFAALLLIFAAGLFPFWRRWSRWIRLVSVVLFFVLLLSTFSRGVLLGLLLAAVVWFIFRRGGRTRFMRMNAFIFTAIGIVCLAHGLYMRDAWLGRLTVRQSAEIRSVQERGWEYADAKAIFNKSAVTGIGPGAYTKAVMSLHPILSGQYLQPVHVAWFLVIIEWGALGILGLILLLRLWWTRASTTGHVPEFVGLIVFIAVSGCFDHFWITSWQLVMNGVFVLALTTVMYNRQCLRQQ